MERIEKRPRALTAGESSTDEVSEETENEIVTNENAPPNTPNNTHRIIKKRYKDDEYSELVECKVKLTIRKNTDNTLTFFTRNGPHTHDLSLSDSIKLGKEFQQELDDVCMKLKTPKSVRDYFEVNTIAGISPEQSKLLKRKKINNDFKKVNTNTSLFPRHQNVENDMAHLINYLQSTNYVWAIKKDSVTEIHPAFVDIPGIQSDLRTQATINDNFNCILLFTQQSLLFLKENSNLLLLDATHKTNVWGWPLYSIMIRDKYGSLVVVFQFLSNSSSSEPITWALKMIQVFFENQFQILSWIPRAFMIDWSQAEISGIKKAFPETKIFLCIYHLLNTLNQFSDPQVKSLMTKAVYEEDLERCKALVQEAILLSPLDIWKTRIRNKWLPEESMRRWSSVDR
jgi:hypothetical protein